MIAVHGAYLSNAVVAVVAAAVVVSAVVVHNRRLKRIERERWQLEIQFVGRASEQEGNDEVKVKEVVIRTRNEKISHDHEM